MLRPRIIPFLLKEGGGLVKTVGFGKPKYVGDPLNAVRIFNDKAVDELAFLDISASRTQSEPNFQLIRDMARECRMPLSYGGGVTRVDQMERIIGLGVEKVSLGNAALVNPQLVADGAARVGNQSVVCVVDVQKGRRGPKYQASRLNATVNTGECAVEAAVRFQNLGSGEIVINDVQADGTGKGFDLDMVAAFRARLSVPITVVGGAGSLEHLVSIVSRFGVLGVGAGSFFVFKGPYRAVLISYPSPSERARLYAAAVPSP